MLLAANSANPRATRMMLHLEVSMMVVTVQSAADPSTLARKAVLAMRHVLMCHGNAAFRTTDFLTSAHARSQPERRACSPATSSLGAALSQVNASCYIRRALVITQ